MLTVSRSFLFFTVIHVRNRARERICHEGQTLDFQSTALPTEAAFCNPICVAISAAAEASRIKIV